MVRPEQNRGARPVGAVASEAFKTYFDKGYDIRPTIAITRAQIKMAELAEATAAGRLAVDHKVLRPGGCVYVTKAALEPVWYLPGVAARFGCSEADLRRTLFEHTAGMFPELVTRNDLEVFSCRRLRRTIYMFGDPASIPDPEKPLAVRVHDECNGSDVFCSDHLHLPPLPDARHRKCVRMRRRRLGRHRVQPKEGRALGEVTKFLVYNARKRLRRRPRRALFRAYGCVAGVRTCAFRS